MDKTLFNLSVLCGCDCSMSFISFQNLKIEMYMCSNTLTENDALMIFFNIVVTIFSRTVAKVKNKKNCVSPVFFIIVLSFHHTQICPSQSSHPPA